MSFATLNNVKSSVSFFRSVDLLNSSVSFFRCVDFLKSSASFFRSLDFLKNSASFFRSLDFLKGSASFFRSLDFLKCSASFFRSLDFLSAESVTPERCRRGPRSQEVEEKGDYTCACINCTITLHCHHQNDSCIKTGSDVSHFNVTYIVEEQNQSLSVNHSV